MLQVSHQLNDVSSEIFRKINVINSAAMSQIKWEWGILPLYSGACYTAAPYGRSPKLLFRG